MTSTHCEDCPYFDADQASLCCSSTICPKPQQDDTAQYDDAAWQQAETHYHVMHGETA
ncbi:hypothetical protein ACF3N0_08810 [Moraxella atlantae]|uniref:hypothetical protein n=1 Tax=Faucicola atlantae TaxID=34059 RepID=UPI00374FE158